MKPEIASFIIMGLAAMGCVGIILYILWKEEL